MGVELNKCLPNSDEDVVRGKDGGVEGVEVGPKGGVVPIGGPVGGGPDRKGMRWGVLNEELCWTTKKCLNLAKTEVLNNE